MQVIERYENYNNGIKVKIEFRFLDIPCEVKAFINDDPSNSQIVCTTKAANPTATGFIGNRGVNMIRDNVNTVFSSLVSAVPSGSAQTIWIDELRYVDPNKTDVTVWMSGFLSIARDSDYLISLTTNGVAVLYLSTDSTEANKVLVASVNGATITSTTVTLKASKR